ncbi:hypothetical protein [Aquimarina longa]|uniref:hypothetical protein n=1 Tax=Aquimarina longa TaxID=1080221 RepID=UPI000782AEFB|nr:hypothetical protein [Aquimarina longa]
MKLIFVSLFITSITASCSNDDDNKPQQKQFGIFKILDDKGTVEMNGVINDSSLKNFNALLISFKNIKQINIRQCDGSNNDDINLKLSSKVNKLGINIHLLDNGLIASGGVDFFIAGKKRTKGKNTKIGVHSWSEEEGKDKKQATDYPKGHVKHLPYIKYYVSVGFTQKQAEDFYYFTINAASASKIHFMTDAEIKKYGLLTN